MKLLLIALLISTNMINGLPKHFVSTNNVSVGEKFSYTIALPIDSDVEIKPELSQFDIIQSTIIENESERQYQYELQLFTIENLIIPTLSITEINDIPPVILEPIYLSLKSTLTPTANELNDIAPLFSIFHINLIFLWLLLLFIAIISALSYSKLKRKKQISIQQAVSEPPLNIALKQIDQLKKTLSHDQLIIKNGYFTLTEIFCNFITEETSINVLDSTTAEMRRLMKSGSKINNDLAKNIIKLSEKMDHYKFSQNPMLDKPIIDQTIQEAVELIKGISRDH